MQKIKLGSSRIRSSRIAYGCMRLVERVNRNSIRDVENIVLTAVDAGINHFDHADIYARGECERIFGKVLKRNPGLRETIIITDKCTIRPGCTDSSKYPKHYDSSASHIAACVEQSLANLGTEYLDTLLLHRPDYLMNPDEINAIFKRLQESGKVRHFGLSNHTIHQVELLNRFCELPILINQIEINIHNTNTIEDGTLSQCQRLGMTPMAWSPLAGVVYPAWGNTFDGQTESRIRLELERQGTYYNKPAWIVMLAWLLKHPSVIIPIIGTTNPERIRDCSEAVDISYRREDWYALWQARTGQPVA